MTIAYTFRKLKALYVRNLLIVIFGTFTFLLGFACSSEDSDPDSYIGTVVDREFTIKNSGVVNYYLGDLGESGSAVILVQAKHHSISVLDGAQYTYEPEDDYLGEDYVEISSKVAHVDTNGNDVSRNTKTRINITIVE